jgi:hypothetical protein
MKGGVLLKGIVLTRFVYSVCVQFDVPPKGWVAPVDVFDIKADTLDQMIIRMDRIAEVQFLRKRWTEYPLFYPVSVSDGKALLRRKRKNSP